MTTSVFLAPTPILQFFNNLGQPNAGGSVLTQVGGVNYPTYEDSAGSTRLPNPIPLNSRGEVSNSSGISTQLFLEEGVVYTFTLYDASHNQINQATWVVANFVPASDYANGYLGRLVNSISDLRAIKSSSYTRVFVTGYNSPGDGGGGPYWYDPTDTTSADNGGSIIVATDGARWKLIYNSILSVTQFGADSTGATDSAPAFRAAIAAAPYGGTVFIPEGIYLMNSAVNNAVLDFTNFPNKGVTFQGVGWTLKTGGSFSFGAGTGPQGSIIKMGSAITSGVDFYHQAPTDLVVGGVGFKDFAIVGTSGAYGTPVGNHGLHFDGTANANGYMENVHVDNVFIDNFAAGYSIFVNGVGNNPGVMAGAVFQRSKFMSFYAPNFGDSNTIKLNTVGANATADARNLGIRWHNVSGATNTRVLNNNLVSFSGMIVCDGGIKPIIDGNEMEQPAGSTNGLGVMVHIRGLNGIVDTPTVTNNSVSQNSVVGTYTPIQITNANGARVGGNRLATPSAYNPIVIDSNSSYTVVSDDNQHWVNGVVQRGVTATDSGTRSSLRSQSWTAYTPTVSSDSGAFTTVSATGAYQLIDTYTLALRVNIIITTAGTAAGDLHFSLPASLVSAGAQSMAGREVAMTADALAVSIPAGGGTTSITTAIGNSPIGNGYNIYISGTIEVQ
ncbi:MAG: hypothetical protein KGI54_15525 [Pseudomonadota bacterium]|nr:hypothetical protein [Pseudomonadota bacterium]